MNYMNGFLSQKSLLYEFVHTIIVEAIILIFERVVNNVKKSYINTEVIRRMTVLISTISIYFFHTYP